MTPQPETTLDRLRYILKQKNLTQASMARTLAIDPARLSKILSGRLPLTEGFINKVAIDMGLSKQWLVGGDALPFDKPAHSVTLAAAPRAASAAGTPVYDIDVTAGFADFPHELTHDRIIGHIDLPHINPDCVIVRVSGDSMTPTINNGSLIAIRPVGHTGTIFWGQIYVVLTDDYCMVKYLRRNPDPACVTLHSQNPLYDDIDIPRAEIRSLFIVETVINYDQRC